MIKATFQQVLWGIIEVYYFGLNSDVEWKLLRDIHSSADSEKSEAHKNVLTKLGAIAQELKISEIFMPTPKASTELIPRQKFPNRINLCEGKNFPDTSWLFRGAEADGITRIPKDSAFGIHQCGLPVCVNTRQQNSFYQCRALLSGKFNLFTVLY